MYCYVKLGFKDLSIPQKIQRARNILVKMTCNVFFPEPTPGIEAVRASINDLEQAHEAALDGGKSRKVGMYDREERLMNLMNSLGGYVQQASNGEKERILSSGFEIKKTGSTAVPLPAPNGLSVAGGRNEGECLLTWLRVAGAKVYTAEISADGLAGWTSCGTSTKTKLLVTGRVSRSKPFFRVATIGTLGQSAWSDVV